MKEGPSIRLIGSAVSEHERSELRKGIEQTFTEDFESLSEEKQLILNKHELRKDERQMALILFADTETNRLLEEAGVPPVRITADRFHIIPEEIYDEQFEKGSDATTDLWEGRAYISFEKTSGLVVSGLTSLHEMFHLKAHQAIHARVTAENRIHLSRLREGLLIHSVPEHGERHEHFRGVNEAIVGQRERLSYAALLEVPEISAQKEWVMSEEYRTLRESIARENGIPADEISWIGVRRDGSHYYSQFSYIGPCATLRYVCEEIRKREPERFETWGSVFKEFENAHFKGDLLGLAKLVESTFGKGSFRILGDMEPTDESAEVCMKALKELVL